MLDFISYFYGNKINLYISIFLCVNFIAGFAHFLAEKGNPGGKG